MLLPPTLARLRVDGGAPYMDARGMPMYPADCHDSARTHPGCERPYPSCLPAGSQHYLRAFDQSSSLWPVAVPSGVHYDLRRIGGDLLQQAESEACAESQANALLLKRWRSGEESKKLADGAS